MNTTKAITTTLSQNTHTQRMIFRVLLASLIALSVVYLYVIGSITFNVLARKSLETTVRTLGTTISSLELTYLNEVNNIDKGYALSNGFVDAHQSIFATRDASRVAVR